jgi:hypothetical protein
LAGGNVLKQIYENLSHIPSSSIGTALLIIAALPQVPGFENLVQLSSTAGIIITYVAGVAGLISLVCFGRKGLALYKKEE